MKKIIFTAVMLISVAMLTAQDAKKVSKWKLNGRSGLNLTQSSYNSWAAGGQNTVAGNLTGALYLKYKKDKTSWDNSADFGYGLSYQGSSKSKTNDKIEFRSTFGHNAFQKLDYSATFSFRSQFDKGYPKYPAEKNSPYSSKFMSPAYSELGIGFKYNPRPELSVELSPIGGKMTFVRDDSLSKIGVFGVKPGKHSYYEFGAFLKTWCRNFKILENVKLTSYLGFFSNLLYNPENIDVNWDLRFDFAITKYINSSIDISLIYDDDIKNGKTGGPTVQIRQILGIGFSYNF